MSGPTGHFIELSTLQRKVFEDVSHELSFQLADLMDVLDIEGDAQNGGGNFKVKHDSDGRTLVRYETDDLADTHLFGPFRVGEIGSPSLHGPLPFRQSLGAPGMATSPAGF